MAYTLTKLPDGDANFGSLNGEFVNLQPSTSDYPTGGYAIFDGVSVVDNSNLNANCDLYRLLAAIPVSGQNGYVLQGNMTTKKVQVFRQNASTGALQEVPANTDLSSLTFELLLLGL